MLPGEVRWIKSIYPFNPFHACQSPYSSGFRVPKTIYMTSGLAAQSGVPEEYQPWEVIRNTEFQPLYPQTYQAGTYILTRTLIASWTHPDSRNMVGASALLPEQCEKSRSDCFWSLHSATYPPGASLWNPVVLSLCPWTAAALHPAWLVNRHITTWKNSQNIQI